MTQNTFNKLRALKTGLSLACFLVAATAWSQVAPGSGTVSYSIGFNHIGQGTNFNNTSTNGLATGFDGGYNVNQYVELGGEFNFFGMPQVDGVNMHVLNYGFQAHFNLTPGSRIVPYGVFGVGGDRLTLSEDGVSASASGAYFGGGAGVNFFVGPNWGVRAELRDSRDGFTVNGASGNTSVFAMTGGIFYQFGGHSAKKK